MKPQGMDSRIPAADRAFVMVRTLVANADFTPEQISAIWDGLRARVTRNGRPRAEFCIRGHERTIENVSGNGTCRRCSSLLQRVGGTAATRRLVRRDTCECGHEIRVHDGEDLGYCYHIDDAGDLDCSCTCIRRVRS